MRLVRCDKAARLEELNAVLAAAAETFGADQVPTVTNQGNSSGKVPLHHAAWAGNTESVKALLAAGCAINPLTIRGQTPLHFAAGKGREDTVAALLAFDGGPRVAPIMRRAKLRVKTVKGDTILDLALGHGISAELCDMIRTRELEEEPAHGGGADDDDDWGSSDVGADANGWIDFQSAIRERPHRREVMGACGTLIYTAERQQVSIDLLAGPDGHKPPAELLGPDRRPGGTFDDCCALVVCECRKRDPSKNTRKGRWMRGGSGWDGTNAEVDVTFGAVGRGASVEETKASWATFCAEWIPRWSAVVTPQTGSGQQQQQQQQAVPEQHSDDTEDSLQNVLQTHLIALAGGVCVPGEQDDTRVQMLSSTVAAFLHACATSGRSLAIAVTCYFKAITGPGSNGGHGGWAGGRKRKSNHRRGRDKEKARSLKLLKRCLC